MSYKRGDNKGDWVIRSILKTEMRPNLAGKQVMHALVDWENTWVPKSELEKEHQDCPLADQITVLGPIRLGEKPEIKNPKHEWVIENRKENGEVEQRQITYEDLKARYPTCLLAFYEAAVRIVADDKNRKARRNRKSDEVKSPKSTARAKPRPSKSRTPSRRAPRADRDSLNTPSPINGKSSKRHDETKSNVLFDGEKENSRFTESPYGVTNMDVDIDEVKPEQTSRRQSNGRACRSRAAN